MNQPLVSVVVPIYNVELYLNRCIESIVNQTYSDLEIILVDDGSPDHCPVMCDEWAEKDNRIKVIHKENAGVGMARNIGIESASGQYMFFVDADDYLDIQTIEKCINISDKNHADIVMFGNYDVNKDGTIEKKHIVDSELYFDREQAINHILPGLFTYDRGFGISVCMKMFDLEVIKQNNLRFGREREFISEDACFLLELFAHILSVAIVPENLYYYQKNEKSFSRRYKENTQVLNDAFLLRAIDICKDIGYSEYILSYIKARYHMYTIAGMKQIVSCELPKKEKQKALRSVFENTLLRSTITDDVFSLETGTSRIFWKLFLARHHRICCLLLWYKAHS